MEIENTDGLTFLGKVPDASVDLILTDPPFIISKESGMNTHYNNVQAQSEKLQRTEEQWLEYKESHDIQTDDSKALYMEYGTIYGKKYCVKTDYGTWDSEFTMETLESIIKEYYKKLRPSGTLVIFFDIWKIGELKAILERQKFKQVRFIEWVKTNPQPLNSNTNYLTNCREVALTAVKGGKPTFNSSYDTGVYSHPIQGGKQRFHPTTKSLDLFEQLIRKHSNEGDMVMDTFLGSGTTALAAKRTGRRFRGCEVSEEYYTKMLQVHGAILQS
jgi:site-specific DNA-methyltransferase (adenine-specific)